MITQIMKQIFSGIHSNMNYVSAHRSRWLRCSEWACTFRLESSINQSTLVFLMTDTTKTYSDATSFA